jgi:hypothetical protein
VKALLGIVGGFVLTLAVFASGLAFATWLLVAKPVRQATPAIGVSELWTRDARPVDPQRQGLQRIPAKQAAGASAGSDAKPDTGTQAAVLTKPAQAASSPQLKPLPDVPQPAADADAAQQAQPPQQQAQLPAAHLEWCANRYRSYRPDENSYRSYSGELRPCISPYYDPDGGDRTASTDTRRDGRPVAGQGEISDDQAEMEGYAASTDGYATTYGGPPEEISPEEQNWGRGRQASADHVDDCFSRYRSYRPQDNTYQPFDGGPRRQCE